MRSASRRSVKGLDALGRCELCEHGGTLAHNLRLMAAGVTRNPVTGRYVSVRRG